MAKRRRNDDDSIDSSIEQAGEENAPTSEPHAPSILERIVGHSSDPEHPSLLDRITGHTPDSNDAPAHVPGKYRKFQ